MHVHGTSNKFHICKNKHTRNFHTQYKIITEHKNARETLLYISLAKECVFSTRPEMVSSFNVFFNLITGFHATSTKMLLNLICNNKTN